MTRAFVAVKLPPRVLAAVSARTEGVEVTGGRMTAQAQWHLTLQFLGDIDLGPVVAALEGFDVPGGRVRLGGAGSFPENARRGRILWINVRQGAGVLECLANRVAARLAPLGFEPEPRAFFPHLTLARCPRPADLRAPIAAIGPGPIGKAWKVEELTVFESQLRPAGARYVERATVPLPG